MAILAYSWFKVVIWVLYGSGKGGWKVSMMEARGVRHPSMGGEGEGGVWVLNWVVYVHVGVMGFA